MRGFLYSTMCFHVVKQHLCICLYLSVHVDMCVCVFGCVFAESPAQAPSMEALNNDRLTVVITLFQLKDVNRP